MKTTRISRWLAVIALIGLFFGITYLITMFSIREYHESAPMAEPDGPPPLFEHTPALFGSIPYWDQDAAVAVFKEEVDRFDIISVFWYRIDADGNIEKYRYAKEDPSLIQFAKDNNVKVLGLIANLPENGDWDAARVDAIISDPEKRTAHIEAIVALADAKGFDGINIDYEFLEDSQTNDFSKFIQELSAALHERGKILAVAVHAQYPGGETRGQHLRALASADILAVMAYDEHWESSGPGPVASVPWVRAILGHIINGLDVPAERVYLGMPLYGYDWPRARMGWGGAQGFEFEDVSRLQKQYGFDIGYDEYAQAPRFTYLNGGREHQAWFEDVRSFEAKYNLAKEFNVGGIALWRLGREDRRIYEVLDAPAVSAYEMR